MRGTTLSIHCAAAGVAVAARGHAWMARVVARRSPAGRPACRAGIERPAAMAAAMSGGRGAPMAVRLGGVSIGRQPARAAMCVFPPRMPRRGLPGRRRIGAMQAAQAWRAVRPRSPRGWGLREAVRVCQHGRCPSLAVRLACCRVIRVCCQGRRVGTGDRVVHQGKSFASRCAIVVRQGFAVCGVSSAGPESGAWTGARFRAETRCPTSARGCGVRTGPALAAKDEARRAARAGRQRAGMPASSFRTRLENAHRDDALRSPSIWRSRRPPGPCFPIET